MGAAPEISIDVKAFWDDPYPTLAAMRARTPLCFVPELGAVLITRRADVFENEKRVDVFSSVQPGGLMTRLMGQNMMRKDGADHLAERRAIFPTVSPKTVRDHWCGMFETATAQVLDRIEARGSCDLVRDFAMPVSAEALKLITGLTEMTAREMDQVSQGMIDGIANYASDAQVEAQCHACTALIDAHIGRMTPRAQDHPDASLLSVQLQAGLSPDQISANIKLAISGGQNEPRDAIAGTVWALLSHPGQLAMVQAGKASFAEAFNEYARWMSPIGMSPREVVRDHDICGVCLRPGQRAFLMFGSANRDEDFFERPEAFDLQQDISAAIPFGAGPHFCAGAWAARVLIGNVALPMLFDRLPGLSLDTDRPATFGGWAFRGPQHVNVTWPV